MLEEVDLFGNPIKDETVSFKDWTGTSKSMFKMLGASNHCKTHARQSEDYYATCPQATEWLCRLEKFDGPILEPACGEGHISKVLIANGYEVVSRDLVDRGFGEVADFLSPELTEWDGDIVTNPPFKYAQEFCEKALAIVPEGRKVAMFCKLTFCEGKRRKDMFVNNPPVRVWVSSSRLQCAMNGVFDGNDGIGGAMCYAWFIWEKGFKGHTEMRWFN